MILPFLLFVLFQLKIISSNHWIEALFFLNVFLVVLSFHFLWSYFLLTVGIQQKIKTWITTQYNCTQAHSLCRFRRALFEQWGKEKWNLIRCPTIIMQRKKSAKFESCHCELQVNSCTTKTNDGNAQVNCRFVLIVSKLFNSSVRLSLFLMKNAQRKEHIWFTKR